MQIPPLDQAARASQQQFGQQAAFYVNSASHRSSDSLPVMVEFAALTGTELVLDVGTGIGFAAFALAHGAQWVIATDITEQMLAEATAEQARQGRSNVSFGLANAECLPFYNETFQRVACSKAAHHFGKPDQAIHEMARVLAPKGILILADTVCPENRDVGLWMDRMEKRRDPSHHHNLTSSEWRSVLEAAGLELINEATTVVPLTLLDWTRRSGTPPEETERLLVDFVGAPPAAKDAFHIQAKSHDVSFSWECSVFQAVKPLSH